jgi:hypothetical protein
VNISWIIKAALLNEQTVATLLTSCLAPGTERVVVRLLGKRLTSGIVTFE